MSKKETVAITPSTKELIDALVQAISITKPVEKKTIANRKPGDPWQPTDGSKKLKLKRKMYEHGILMDPDYLSNDDIDVLNKVKVGRFLNGQLIIAKRKDGGINIDFPHKTASQRLRFLSQFRITSLKDICDLAIKEAKAQMDRKVAGLPLEDDGSED